MFEGIDHPYAWLRICTKYGVQIDVQLQQTPKVLEALKNRTSLLPVMELTDLTGDTLYIPVENVDCVFKITLDTLTRSHEFTKALKEVRQRVYGFEE